MLRNTLSLAIVASLFCATATLRAGESSAAPLDADTVLKSQKLKLDARLAAEKGDFATAAKNIAEAADLLGDRTTARNARRLTPKPQAAGGNSFAQYQELIQLIVDQTINGDGDNWAAPYGNGTVGQISINSNGVLFAVNALANAVSVEKSMSRLNMAAEYAKTANQNTDVRQASDLRMVSLTRLEKHLGQLVKEGRPISEDLRTIAGITEIKYLFVFPETQDIVIAGPAGNWIMTADGRALNNASQRPTLNLDDLVTLSKVFSNDGARSFMCTINPKPNQVVAVQQYVSQNQNSLSKQTVARFTKEVEQRLGLQNVIVQGIPNDSRVASVIVEADYRMKEIGIGKRQGPQGMKSYFDLLSRSEQRGSGSMDALRWWMAVGYDHINMAPNGQVFEFAGNAVRCLSENELVKNDGTRQSTGKSDRANQKFAELFTEHLPALAAQDPVFADLQNIFDLALVSALVHSQGLNQQAGWRADTFVTEGAVPTQRVEVPRELMTAAAYKVYRSGSIVIQVAGGVRVDLSSLLNDKSSIKTVEGLTAQTSAATPIGQDSNRWWWDAAERQN